VAYGVCLRLRVGARDNHGLAVLQYRLAEADYLDRDWVTESSRLAVYNGWDDNVRRDTGLFARGKQFSLIRLCLNIQTTNVRRQV